MLFLTVRTVNFGPLTAHGRLVKRLAIDLNYQLLVVVLRTTHLFTYRTLKYFEELLLIKNVYNKGAHRAHRSYTILGMST